MLNAQDTVQLTDGDWNDEPFGKPAILNGMAPDGPNGEAPYQLTQTVTLDTEGCWTDTVLQLDVIGDFNAANGESCTVTINTGFNVYSAVLFDSDASNDGPFTGDTGPTSIGAQPGQGSVTINGHRPENGTFVDDDIYQMTSTDDAVFATTGNDANVFANLGPLGDSVEITFTISPEDSQENGVDFAQIDLTLTGEECDGKEASNAVFYWATTEVNDELCDVNGEDDLFTVKLDDIPDGLGPDDWDEWFDDVKSFIEDEYPECTVGEYKGYYVKAGEELIVKDGLDFGEYPIVENKDIDVEIPFDDYMMMA
jgi:hypothetical protein